MNGMAELSQIFLSLFFKWSLFNVFLYIILYLQHITYIRHL